MNDDLRRAMKNAFHSALEGPCLTDKELMWNTACEWLLEHLSKSMEELESEYANLSKFTTDYENRAVKAEKKIKKLQTKLIDLQVDHSQLKSKLDICRRYAWYSPQFDAIVIQTIFVDCQIMFEWAPDDLYLASFISDNDPIENLLWTPLGEL